MKKQFEVRLRQGTILRKSRKPLASCNQPKRRGELAELAFLYKVASLGFAVAKPYGDSERFDFVVISGPRLWRVQVKSIHKAARNGYGIHSCEVYTPQDVDWMVVYVVPEDAWYVVPIEATGGRRSMYFHPSGSRWGLCRYEKYREAWWQMRPDHRLHVAKR